MPDKLVPCGMIAVARFTLRNIPRKQPRPQSHTWSAFRYFHQTFQRRMFSASIGKTLPTCDNLISLDPNALGIAPTFAPIPNPLSRTQFVIVRLPMPPDPAVAASAPNNIRSTPPGMLPKQKNPANVRPQTESGTKKMLTVRRKTKM